MGFRVSQHGRSCPFLLAGETWAERLVLRMGLRSPLALFSYLFLRTCRRSFFPVSSGSASFISLTFHLTSFHYGRIRLPGCIGYLLAYEIRCPSFDHVAIVIRAEMCGDSPLPQTRGCAVLAEGTDHPIMILQCCCRRHCTTWPGAAPTSMSSQDWPEGPDSLAPREMTLAVTRKTRNAPRRSRRAAGGGR